MVMQINLVVVVVDFWSGEQKPDLQPEIRIALTAWSLPKKKTTTTTTTKQQPANQYAKTYVMLGQVQKAKFTCAELLSLSTKNN